MSYKNQKVAEVAELLKSRLADEQNPAAVLRAVELRALYEEIKTLPPKERASFGAEVNQLKQELEQLIAGKEGEGTKLAPIDVTAPFDANVQIKPQLLPSQQGSVHPLMSELTKVLDILNRMGFEAVESRQLDDDYHMFETLNFPEGHPARDDYDTFMTTDGLIAPAHTSTMQNRVINERKDGLTEGNPIRVVLPGRVFRNEDLDARHEHTFYQLEGICIDKGINAGHLLTTFKVFLEEYYKQKMELKLQPFYFPFTEPSFEFVLSCPFCQKKGCNICSQTGWIELGGCGMIHPNVLRMAGVDPSVYTGFAWGIGIERLVMMKNNIEDIRHFESGKLDFLRQFS